MTLEEVPVACGVYLLYLGGVCQYVGSAVNMRFRVRVHAKRVLFDEVKFVYCQEPDLIKVEQEHIDLLNPILNRAKIALRNAKISGDATGGFFRIKGEDLELLERLKTKIGMTHGTISNIAVVRMALINMEQKTR